MEELLSELYDLQQKYAQLAFENWVTHTVFTWNWWYLVLIFTALWFIFMKLLDRSRGLCIWLFGLVVIIIT